MKAYFLLPILALSTFFAQSQDNVVDYGCIAIKQTFYGIGEGKHEPILDKSVVTLKGKKEDGKNEVELTLTKDECLNANVVAVVKVDGSDNYILYNGDIEVTDAINVKSTIDNMANDDSRSFEFKIESLIPGTKTTITQSASDPYRNWFNFGKRNSYTLNTTLIYDVPVSIQVLNAEEKDNLNIDEHDCLELQFGDFIAGGDAILKYRVNGVNTEWQRCDRVQVTPQGTVVLSYGDLFGNEMSNVAKAIQFVVEKKMLNDVISQGNIVECTFYRNAPTFEIEKVINTTCGLKVGIKVEKGLDLFEEIIKDVNNYYWELSYDLNCTTPNGKNFDNLAIIYKTNVVPIVDSENDNSFIVDLTECINQLHPTSNIDTNGNENGYKGVFKLCFSLVNNPAYQDLNIVPNFFKVDKTIEKVTIDQIGPKDNLDDTSLLYSSTSYSDISDQFAVLKFTDKYNRFDYTITKVNDDGWGEKKVSLDSYLADTKLDYENLDSYKKAFHLDSLPLGNEYKNNIEKEWQAFYQGKYNKWFVDYCKPQPITGGFSSMSRKTKWEDINDNYPLLMIYDEKDSTSYFFWMLINGGKIGAYAIQGVTKEFVDSWYDNYESNYYEINKINKKLNYKGELPSAPVVENMGASIYSDYVKVNVTMSNSDTKSEKFYDSIIPKFKFIDYSGCKVMVQDGNETYELHVCGRGADYHNSTVLHSSTDITGFKCGIYATNGEFIYYNGEYIVTGSNLSNVDPVYEVKSIKYASKIWVQYEYKDGTKCKQYIGNSATPSFRDINKWKDEFYKEEYAKYLSNVGYKLYNIEYNKKQTYTLTDSYGCPSKFDVVVYSAEFEEISSKSPSKWNSSDGEIELKFKSGPKIKRAGDEYSPGSTISVSNLSAVGDLSFAIDDGSTIQYHYNIGHGIDTVCASYCSSEKYGKIKVVVGDKSTEKIYILNKDDAELQRIKTTISSVVFDKVESGTYKVLVEAEGVSIQWPKNIIISDSAFSMKVTPSDAIDIGGNGSAEIVLNNSEGKSLTWIFDNKKEEQKPTLSSISPGSHSISATLDDYCTINQNFEIKEPYINATITIEEYDGNCSVTVSDVSKNIINGKLVLYCGDAKVDNWNKIAITKDSKSYALKFCPNGGTAWEIATFSLKEGQGLNGLTTEHTLNQVHKCPEKPMSVSIEKKNTNENDLVFVYNNTEYSGEKSVSIENSGIETLSYQVIGRKIEKKTNNKCTVNLTYKLRKEYTENLHFVEPFGGDYVINDFLCNESNTTELIINTLNGGADDASLQYGFDNSSWLDLNSNQIITISNPNENKGKLEPTTYEYNLYLKDSKNGCVSQLFTNTHSVTCPAKLSVDIKNVINPICEGTNTGVISVKASGGTLSDTFNGYCYFIDPEKEEEIKNSIGNEDGYAQFYTKKDEEKQFDKLYAGAHRVIVFDNNQCMASATPTLNYYYNPRVLEADTVPVSCHGMKDGQINVLSARGTSKIKSFQLYDGETLLTECDFSDTLSQNKSNAHNDNDYSWSAIDKRGNKVPLYIFDTLYSKGYNLALTDIKGCVTNYSGKTIPDNKKKEWYYVDVTQPDPLKLSITSQDTIIREYGKPGGSVNVNVSGGNKGTFNIFLDTKKDTLAQVIWGNHAFNDIFRPGTHKLYVTDHKECIDSATTKQMRQPDSPLSIEVTPHDALCNGSFGSITVRGSGGWNGYQYSCSSKSNLYGANQNEYTFYDIKGGYYEVSVTDAEGVTATQKVYVNTPPKLMAVPLLRASSCKNDGLISANITGGTMPYLVKPDSSSVTPFYFEPYITNSNLTIIPKQLAAGDYSIVVVDSNNCEILMSATIADSSVKATVKPVYPTAHEFANGRLEAVVQQGAAPYTYQWKNHNTGQICTNAVWDKVGAGVYSLDVSDANNCSVSVPITYLATNGDLPLIIDTIIGETAVGACNGMARFTSDTTGFKSITLHGNSGVEKDITSMVNNKLQFELTGLAPDSYLLECVLADTTVRYAKFTIARYEPMHLIVSNIVDVSKQDAANGSAKLRIDGGRAPFIVQMLRGDDFLADTVLNDRNLPMSGLTAANYMVSVVDESANRVNAQFIIRKPEKPLQLLAQSVENPSCNGYTNGRIILKATGGWGDYEYAAAEGEFGRATAYDGRGAAVHTFVAIDSKGITDTLKVELVEPLPLTARVVQVDSVSCFGRTDGSVIFDIAGGTAPYTVHYDDFFDKKSNFVGSLNAGTHTFSITDTNFCQAVEGSLVVDVPQPDSLQVAHDSVIHTTCNTDNGRIFITIAGGTAPYANSWREDGLIKERFANLTAIDSLQGYSLYEVEVADAKGCKAGKSYRINPSSGPKIERVRTLPVLCYGDSTGTAVIDSADIVPATPYSPFRIEWPHGENAMSVGNLPAGWNVVFIIDSNNCKNSTSFNIDAPSPIEIIKVGSRDASCYGYADGRISTLTLGGVGGYRYLWSNGDTLPDIDSIAKGAYTIVVADRNNCRDSAVFAIGQPDSLHVEIGEENVLMCPDNTYEFIPTDGFKTYCWILNDSTLSDKRSLIASEQGEYHLVATYGANCISRDTVTITIGDDLLEADFYMASDASKDNTIALVELSNMKTDSIRWDFSAADFEVVDSSLYELQLKPNTIGLYNITLWAYSSGCVSYITKQVEISDLPDTTDNIKLGYDPLIKSVTVKPNPTNGLFRVDVQLRESHDAEMTISSVSHGTQIEQRKLAGDAEYSESFDLSNASDGVYILRISASDEHRVLKVLIAK